ncbi:MAG: hypothetical protein AAGH60_02065 [Pseudomonadota bacterium]
MINATTPANGEAMPEKEMTDEEWAAMDFEPWTHADDEWVPPTNVEWAELANPHLVTIRLAWTTMYKTKPELMEIVEGLGEDGVLPGLMESMQGSIDYFTGVLAILEGAQARIIVAGMSVET